MISIQNKVGRVRYWVVVCAFFSFCTAPTAPKDPPPPQNVPSPPAPSAVYAPEVIERWKIMADSLYGEQQYEAALALLYQVSDQLKAAQQWKDFTYFEQDITWNLGELSKESESVARMKKSRALLQDVYPLGANQLLLFQARNEQWCDQYNAALEHLEQAATYFEQVGITGDDLSLCYKNAGQIYVRRLDYPNAFRCFDAAERADTAGNNVSKICLNRGIGQHFLKDYDKAIVSFHQGLAARPEAYYKALLGVALAGTYIETRQKLGEAKKLLTSARQFFSKNLPVDESLMSLYQSCARLSEAEGDYSGAVGWYAQAQQEAARVFENKSRECAKMWVQMGDFYAQQQQDSLALNCYQQAMIQVFPEFDQTDWRSNPPVRSAYVESFGMTAPARKAGLLLRLAEQQPASNQADYLLAASGAFQLAFAGIQKLREAYSDEYAKLYIGDYVHDYLEQALEVQRHLYQQTGDTVHLEHFFQFLEFNKAGILAEALQKNKALEAAGLPEATVQQFFNFRSELAEQEAKIAAQKFEPETRNVELKKLDALKEAFKDFQDSLRHNPLFDRFIRQIPTSTLAEVRQHLQADQALLEYFEGTKAIYLLLVQKQAPTIFRIEKTDSLVGDIDRYLTAFRQSDIIESNATAYFPRSNRLFQQLCPIGKSINSVVIIPDGVLAFIPFAAFITEPGYQGTFAEAPYLAKTAALSHSWSASLWLSPMKSPVSYSTGKRFVQFAPEFPDKERGLATLKYSALEVAPLSFSVFSRQAADVRQFKEALLSPMQVLHLSTHGQTGKQPGIELFDRRLLLAEVFGYRLQLELVALSACETGLGRIEKGEGVINFTYAFAYAGASSILTSLWSIDQQSTADIFNSFYQQLKSHNRVAALQQAQKAYLSEDIADYYKSPYYWAGLVYYGQDGPIDTGLSFWAKIGLIGLVALGLFLLIAWLRK